ncbi:hypothetical protein SZN_34917 [Streptomyces zinciresistens K42]|uniref:Uncharacterized protein n=1 Tax=Streptomyces zinciresistens K42 TaxID=700597 RepID=G2GN78_9ACTN|nr:hypothetical protein [Streptomyces zinciresistens]EGX55039.1 hypothetical protein SZN_34917 [Streptomyces zinciresistens K42]
MPVPVTHVTHVKRDAVYDPRAHQAAMAVTVHYENGGVCESMLVLTPAQVELYHHQLSRMIQARESAQDRRQ